MDRANFTMIRIGRKGAMTYAKSHDLLFTQIDGVQLASAETIVQVS